MGMAPQSSRPTTVRRMPAIVRRVLFLGLVLVAALALTATSRGPLSSGSQPIAYADSAGQHVSTHVVVKLKSGATIEWLLEKLSTWR